MTNVLLRINFYLKNEKIIIINHNSSNKWHIIII